MMISFGSRFITNVNIAKIQPSGRISPYNASFVELDINSQKDYETLRTIGMNWENGSSYAGDMLDTFVNQKFRLKDDSVPKYRYFALTDDCAGKFDENSVLGVISVWERDKDCYIPHLQVKPDCQYSSLNRKYKEIGKKLTSSVLNMFPQKDFILYAVTSELEKFYENLQFVKDKSSIYMKLFRH